MGKSAALAVAAVGLVAGLAPAALAEEQHPGHAMVTPDQIRWQAIGSLPPGARVAVLEGDPAQAGDFTMRVELPANYVVPRHTHPTVERVTVLEGTFYLGIGEVFERDQAQALPPGSLAIMDTGVPMFAYTGAEPVVFQINGTGPWGIDYLDPAEDPRKKASE
jgi:quercetin dioxygenase-like cupin family protein